MLINDYKNCLKIITKSYALILNQFLNYNFKFNYIF